MGAQPPTFYEALKTRQRNLWIKIFWVDLEDLDLYSDIPLGFVFNIVLLLFICICITNNHDIQHVNSQVLSSSELSSAQWIVQQYQLSVAQDSNSICISSFFKCGTGTDGAFHLLAVNVQPRSLLPSGTPSNTLVSLDLSQVTSIVLQPFTSVVTDPSLDIMSKLKNMPLLQTAQFIHDTTFTTIPNDFMIDKPILNKIYIASVNLESASNLFNGSNIEVIDIVVSKINSLVLDTSFYYPKLQTLTIAIQCDNPLNWVITNTSFPALLDLYISSTICNKNVIVDILMPMRSVGTMNQPTSPSTMGYIKTNLLYPEKVEYYTFGGYLAQYNTPNMSLFTNLKSFNIDPSHISTIPNIPIPKLITTFMIKNGLIGTLPPNLLDNVPTKAGISFSGNQNLVGPITESYCSVNFLSILNTSITTIPDCFWCYPGMIDTTLTKPSNIQCIPRIDSFNLYSYFGVFNITGSLLGWAKGITTPTPSTTYTIPNKLLSFFMNLTLGYQQTFSISLIQSLPNYVFSVKETTFTFGTRTTISQNANSVELNVTFSDGTITDPEITPSLLVDTSPCIVKQIYSDNTINCVATILPNSSNMIYASNSFFSTKSSFTKYTFVTAVELQPIIYPPTSLKLHGFFGNLKLPQDYVYIRSNQTDYLCNITRFESSIIECTLTSQPPSGQMSLGVVVYNGNFTSDSLVYIPYPLPPNDNCVNRTNNCNGHGQCINGQCVCDQGYYDDCKFQTDPNIIVETNRSSPSFSFKDYSFSFNILSIQELDLDDVVIRELNTNSWNSSESVYSTYSSIVYVLTSHQNQSVTVNATDFLNTNVTTYFEFSNQSRSVSFGGQDIQLASGSIKISVNITNWPFVSVLTHLRVVFSTIINTDQQNIIGCDDSANSINPFENFANGDSLQYLRVVKNTTQFFGRFLDYSVSDGRRTYSKTQVLNVTKKDAEESIATIGISLPQSQQSILDPDFSALLVNPKSYCDSNTKNDNWKMIVGIVVGVVGGLCLAIVLFFIIKSNRYYCIRREKILESKMKSTIFTNNK
ncbi:hypothetical protein DFA_04973 [Cavenderia fasciculata]|uniref:ComC supersandwich domain-containing protein n=1 Tax=Cavenderia fasciculata TaxID=261658 RepID=F4PMP6_CACFS|nr:uncharacterized protein DFA_04973 [Cavenderia fasciculata]EGG22843.1 hypothetical protein DFA_04973 [Cavenderia fasciculata]|eukprot:XP_004360694.1 hypothetical protein DFA_04973 [Cavenderia fasciculata]